MGGGEAYFEWDAPENPQGCTVAGHPEGLGKTFQTARRGRGCVGGGAQESAWPSGRPQPALMGTTRGVSWNPGLPVTFGFGIGHLAQVTPDPLKSEASQPSSPPNCCQTHSALYPALGPAWVPHLLLGEHKNSTRLDALRIAEQEVSTSISEDRTPPELTLLLED